MKFYSSTSEKTNVNNYIEKLHQKEIALMNKNFYIDNNEVSDSISSSIKYLMKKKERENNIKTETGKTINVNNIITNKRNNKIDIDYVDYIDVVNKKISEHNNFNFNKFVNESFKEKNNDLINTNFAIGIGIKSDDVNLKNFNSDIKNKLSDAVIKDNLSSNNNIDVSNLKNKAKGKKKNEKNSDSNDNVNVNANANVKKSMKDKCNNDKYKVVIEKNEINGNRNNDEDNDFNKEELEKELLLNF